MSCEIWVLAEKINAAAGRACGSRSKEVFPARLWGLELCLLSTASPAEGLGAGAVSPHAPGHELFSQPSRMWWVQSRAWLGPLSQHFPSSLGTRLAPQNLAPGLAVKKAVKPGAEQCWGHLVLTAPLPGPKLPETPQWIHQPAHH